jgi:vacuolar-type H+-ATPase subunit E/Vma4
LTLEDVIADVRRDGERQAAEIVKAGGEECLKVVGQAEGWARATLDREMARAEADATKLHETEIAAAETEGTKLVMEARRKLFDAVRAGALSRMAQMPRERKERILASLASTALREIPGARLRCAKSEEPIVKAVSKGAAVLADLDCAGGIVAESADGKVRLTMTYEAILDEAWSKGLAKVAKELEA